ncbi:vesicle transport through interaction with t-SNAREs homolog 1A-like isoform X2 [Gordionus sp. m RMFG-2023]|uniref:vesicle transport through interaction with t-SNAREs homolog 1A-like isoform X2 n=1 Tax=Gordionus sp. m RMFG-2023 TaxID=3053472 RepID=UPI0031FD2DF3
MLSANIIQSHIKNFENLLQVIKERVNRSALVNERYVNLPEVSKLLEEGHELLEQIDLESNDLPMNEKQHIKYLSDQYKTQLDGLDKTYELKISQKSNDYLEGDNCKDEEKQSLLANLDRCTDNIDHGYRVALESEKIGAEILTDLKWQRESLERSHDRNFTKSVYSCRCHHPYDNSDNNNLLVRQKEMKTKTIRKKILLLSRSYIYNKYIII